MVFRSVRNFSLALAAFTLTACGGATHAFPGVQGASSQLAAQARGGAGFRVVSESKSKHWAKIERLTDNASAFPEEHSRPNGRLVDPEIVAAFGTDMPPSREVLLHFAPGWDTGTGVPVLLVHGAIVDANSNWATPHGKPGLMPALVAAHKRVFAVTFAHRHGDNTLQAEQLANAIARIRQVTGAAEVDVVAHSKGTVAARALLSGIKESWMGTYKHDVRKLIMIAGPHLGLDYPFRHPAVNLALFKESDNPLANAPMSWTHILVGIKWLDTGAKTLMRDQGDYFPGQAQMLARWDTVYPLGMLEQDWYTTYHGGRGFISESPGIDKAIAAGHHYIDTLRKHPLDAGVKLSILAGDKANMSNVLNENGGPSDGVVFVKSATATADLVRGGAKLGEVKVMHLNHMDLIIDPAAQKWVVDTLD